MGVADLFTADERATVKVGDLWDLMVEAAKVEYLENGIRAGVPTEYLKGVLTGEPVELPEPVLCEGEELGGSDDFWDFLEALEDSEEILFEEKGVYKNAEMGDHFILTEKGYECSPEKVKAEREAGKPIKGFEYKVPESWLSKGYVVSVKDE